MAWCEGWPWAARPLGAGRFKRQGPAEDVSGGSGCCEASGVTALPRTPYYPPARAPREFVVMLANATYAMHRAVLVGNPAQVTAEAYERMTHPRPGDIVVEISSVSRSDWPMSSGVGELLFAADRKPRTAEEWEEAVAAGFWKARKQRPRANVEPDLFDYFYVDPLDGAQRTCWENANFIAVPGSPFGEPT